MSVRNRNDWSTHVDRVIRSQHYTWLGEGLGGEPLERALADITADMMHICAREGISWETLLQRGQAQFEQEEATSSSARHASRLPC
jgi:hypothetical protein